MSGEQREVHSAEELSAAVADKKVGQITIAADLSELPMLRISPGQILRAAGERTALFFASGQDGVQLSTNNQLENLYLHTDQDRRALFNDTSMDHLGRFVLRNLSINGVVQLLARDKVRGGHVEVEELHIEHADARNYEDRPKGYGVEVIPGAFMLCRCLACGTPCHGVFEATAGRWGARRLPLKLRTANLHSALCSQDSA
jgi:hypothetical protein